MKTIIIAVLCLVTFATPALAKGRRSSGGKNFKTKSHSPVRVKGYTKKSGVYVAPSVRTTPNKSKFDNYSSKGNANPYTGKQGTVDPLKPKVNP